ncbi:iron-containing alcohol dehydrogenase [Desulfovibrio aminophilus]|uniref:iron-containing alcohol dehydrogenase n=1 Tax=Desulfovibrio aminophilus TaxID=81425 RepID=UPI003390D01B
MWDETINVHDVKEIRTKTTTYLGVGAIAKMPSIANSLRARGVNQVLCVTGGHSYRLTGAWDHVASACKAEGIGITLYDKVTPNPTTDTVDEAARLGRETGAQAVIAIGGGSPIDAGKSAAVMLANPGHTAEELYTGAFVPEKAAPIVVVNLTHGTGSEVNRFAVATITSQNYKPAIAYDCLYPLFSIDDPGLMTKLSPAQTRFVSIDAVNHVVEAATALTANPLSELLAGETIRLVAAWLPKALADPADLRARYCLAYAAMIAGTAFDNGMLHITHALEHPLSAVKPELAHGLGLAMILPAVVAECYPARPATLSSILAPLAPGLSGKPEEAQRAAKEVEQWLASVGVADKLADQGFGEADIERLCDLVEQTPSLASLLSLAPAPCPREHVAAIYRASLRPMR